ncbi:hypothetical protein C4J83_3851 [Pseudomonas sp. LBUM920]|nr:hypothetical protein C4J83_3851 [Pseudomonas sp. LBUM920]
MIHREAPFFFCCFYYLLYVVVQHWAGYLRGFRGVSSGSCTMTWCVSIKSRHS